MMMNLFTNEMTNTAADNGSCVSELLGVSLQELEETTPVASPVSRFEFEADRARAKLLVLVSRYTILLDTCAVLSDRFAALLEHLLPILRAQGGSMLVPYCVVMELRHLGQRGGELAEKVSAALECLLDLKRQGLVTVCGEADEARGDRAKVSLVLGLMQEQEILVVTNDQGLSRSLMDLSRLGLTGGRHVAVSRINGHGFLSRFQMPGGGTVAGVRADGSRAWRRSHCIDCGGMFTIFDTERDYLLNNGLALPRRCPTCRKLRKMGFVGAAVEAAS